MNPHPGTWTERTQLIDAHKPPGPRGTAMGLGIREELESQPGPPDPHGISHGGERVVRTKENGIMGKHGPTSAATRKVGCFIIALFSDDQSNKCPLWESLK